ncbi:MAG: TonB-dependent receptor [Cytophagales bacterium]|nr:TonB-dependent receptor [Cytophagales bacterium]
MRFNKKFLFAAVLGTGMAVHSPLFAQEDGVGEIEEEVVVSINEEDVFELSLDELLNMEITVASKKAEKISDAPGMVTVYSSDDVERYGYYTLKDLSNITSGYSSFSAFGETNIETRGQKAGSWNVNKHLLLIDGIPVNHARANSAPVEYQVPLYFADRVEFLKGPGSALYGTSAFYGVMSITSKQLKENGSLAEGKLTYGDAGNSQRYMANAAVRTETGSANISFSHFKKGFSGDSLGLNNNSFHFNNDNSTFLNASYTLSDTKLKGLGIGMIYMNRNSHSGEHWGTNPISPNNQETWEEVISYIKYKKQLTDKLSLNSYIKHNNSTEVGLFGATWNNFWTIYNSGGTTVQPNSAFSYKTSDIEALGEVTYDIDEKSSIIGGLNFFTRQEVAGPDSYEWGILIPTDTTNGTNHSFTHTDYSGSARVNVASAYLQYQRTFNVMQGLILTAGGRFDNGFSEAGTYSQFSPRAGVVLKATNKLNIKALYGQALRTPGVREIQGNAAIIEETKENALDPNAANGIPDVGAEVIRSMELGLNYNTPLRDGKSNLSIAIAGFYNITSNPLDGEQYSYETKTGDIASPNIFVNSDGSIEASGAEIDIQFALNKNLRFMANHAIAKAYNVDTTGNVRTDFVDVPLQKTNFSMTYTIPKRVSITPVVRHNWGYQVAEGAYDNANSDNILEGFTLVDLNILVPINDNFGVEAQVRNLLDTEWKQPSLLGQNSMIPLARRNFMLTLYAKF